MEEQFVIELYQRLALREPTQEEIDQGLAAIADRGQDAYATEIAETEEVVEIQTVVLPIISLYQAFLERTPEPAGLEFWTTAIQNGSLTFGDLIESFVTTNEFVVVNPGIGANPTNEDLVNLFYTNILGRVPDADGQAFWLSALQNGTIQAGTFTTTFIGSSEIQGDIGAALRAYYADVKDGQIDDPANGGSLRGDGASGGGGSGGGGGGGGGTPYYSVAADSSALDSDGQITFTVTAQSSPVLTTVALTGIDAADLEDGQTSIALTSIGGGRYTFTVDLTTDALTAQKAFTVALTDANFKFDVAVGTAGDDDFVSSGGRAFVFGREGFDRIDHGALTEAIRVENTSSLNGTVTYSDGTTTSYVDVDFVIGTSAADQFINLGGPIRFEGRGGTDSYTGTQGPDQDGLVFMGSPAAVNVDASQGIIFDDGYGNQETFQGFEQINGSAFDDRLVGSAITERLRGGDGDDFINGKGGRDRLTGGNGDDTFVFNDVSASQGISRSVLLDFRANGDSDHIDVGGFSGTAMGLLFEIDIGTIILNDAVAFENAIQNAGVAGSNFAALVKGYSTGEDFYKYYVLIDDGDGAFNITNDLTIELNAEPGDGGSSIVTGFGQDWFNVVIN